MVDGESFTGHVGAERWPAPGAPESVRRSWRRPVAVVAVVAIVGAGVVGLLAPRDTSSGSFSMAGVGMEPTLNDGDLLTTREIDRDEVDRGDVVVLEAPAPDGDGSILTVKRVIAVAGDEIATGSRGEVLINGEPADESYLAPDRRTTNLVPQEVPEGYVFVMGDNRPNSSDSRVFGPVPLQAIVALVDST